MQRLERSSKVIKNAKSSIVFNLFASGRIKRASNRWRARKLFCEAVIHTKSSAHIKVESSCVCSVSPFESNGAAFYCQLNTKFAGNKEVSGIPIKIYFFSTWDLPACWSMHRNNNQAITTDESLELQSNAPYWVTDGNWIRRIICCN